jgi:hypothetical protein
VHVSQTKNCEELKKQNPFIKYAGPEDHLQHQLVTWLKLQYPKLKYHHSPNEGKRSPFERFKYQYLGSDSGFPDLIFPSLHLVIELKIKPNRPTPAQEEWLDYFMAIGWRSEVCYSFEEAQKILTEEFAKMRGLLDRIKHAG